MRKGAVDFQYGKAPQGMPGVGSWKGAEPLMGVDRLEEGRVWIAWVLTTSALHNPRLPRSDRFFIKRLHHIKIDLRTISKSPGQI